MTGSIALDVVIGLSFVYLLYSLLATLIAEIIATNLGLRARNLHSAIQRMMEARHVSVLKSFWIQSKKSITHALYNHPEIKYLSPNNFFSKPSTIKPESFSKTLMLLLLEKGVGNNKSEKIKNGIESVGFDTTTQSYLLELHDMVDGNIEDFQDEVENWYNNVMKQATEWYKRNLQILLFFIGLGIALFFNINTFKIVEKLSVDDKAREQLVALASAYVKNNPKSILITTADSTESIESIVTDSIYHDKLDTLLAVKTMLLKDIKSTQTILGGGSWLPDSLTLKIGKSTAIPDYLEASILPKGTIKQSGRTHYTLFNTRDKLYYLWCLFKLNFLGFATTALAISLGAPFWFDLLNKFMKLRGTISEVTNGKENKNTK